MNQPSLTYEPKLTDDQARVWGILRTRRGRSRAIPMPDLARLVFGDDSPTHTRRVQKIIEQLRNDHHLPIGSSSAKPNNGYWLQVELEELDKTYYELLHRAFSTIKSARAIYRHRAELAGQLRIE